MEVSNGKDTRIVNLRRLLTTIHSAAEAATDIDECIANAENHVLILEDHFRKFVNKVKETQGTCIGMCGNCAWPLYQQPSGNLMHFEITYELGNHCRIPLLGGHNGA